jgi:hypothetical protein
MQSHVFYRDIVQYIDTAIELCCRQVERWFPLKSDRIGHLNSFSPENTANLVEEIRRIAPDH